MDSAGCVAILNRALHATVNSVTQYIAICVPYVPAGFEEQMKSLEQVRGEEAAMASRLTEQISKLDGVPAVGVFPFWNVDLNYLDARFLAKLAAEQTAKAGDELEGELPRVRDDARTHALLKELLVQKRAHAATLAAIASPAAPASPA